MTVDAARAFIREIIGDTNFRELLDEADTPERRLGLARDRGFEFTHEELEDAVVEVCNAETVGDLLDIDQKPDDDVVGHTLGKLVGLQNHQLVPFYFDGPETSKKFFNRKGKVKILEVKPPIIEA